MKSIFTLFCFVLCFHLTQVFAVVPEAHNSTRSNIGTGNPITNSPQTDTVASTPPTNNTVTTTTTIVTVQTPANDTTPHFAAFHTMGVDCIDINDSTKHKKSCYPEDYIAVKLNKEAYDYAAANLSKISLWINGICFKSIHPMMAINNNSLLFKLKYDSSANSPWVLFYAYPFYYKFEHNVAITAGTNNIEFKYSSTAITNTKLFTSVWWQVWIVLPVFILFIILLIYYAKGLVRDTYMFSGTGVYISYKKGDRSNAAAGILHYTDLPYSLARSQFFFWLIIIFFSMVYIWAFKDALAEPTGTILLLLGLSGGTFYISNLIDKSGNSTALAPVAPAAVPGAPPISSDPAAVISSTTQTATPVLSPITGAPIAPQTITQLTNYLKTRNPAESSYYTFISDILNDGKGISLHRLQLVLFTAFLGIDFIWQVMYGLSLPQFSQTLMTLMGISSVTYAGMKTNEA